MLPAAALEASSVSSTTFTSSSVKNGSMRWRSSTEKSGAGMSYWMRGTYCEPISWSVMASICAADCAVVVVCERYWVLGWPYNSVEQAVKRGLPILASMLAATR
ncbi:hypothetical protein D9M71_711710 [compost metagenome]